jgi:hypothetical protein
MASPPEFSAPIGPQEGAAILADLRRLRAGPAPPSPTAAGCIAALIAAAGLMALPFAAPRIPLSSGLAWGLGIALAVVVVVGSLLSVFGEGFVRGAITTDAEAAIEELVAEFPDGDAGRMRAAAVRILAGAYASTGPTTVETFDAAKVAVRLGAALPYVRRIERYLLDKKEIYPVFTNGPGESPSPSRQRP